MADVWSVPLATNLLPSNINAQIAKGPDFSWIGQLPDAYFSGQQAGYQQRNRDAFQGGIPRTDPNDPNSPIDWTQVQGKLLQTGGTPAVPAAVGLAGIDAVNRLPPINGPGAPGVQPQPNFPPSSAGGPQPVSQAQQPADTVPQSRIASANGGSMATPRQIAQNTGGDPAAIAQSLGVGVDDPVDMGNPQNRQTVIGSLRPQQPTANPQPQAPQAPQAPQPQQAAQAQPQSVQGLQQQLQYYEGRAALLSEAARRAAAVKSPMADQYNAAAQDAAKQAQAIREQLTKISPETATFNTAKAANDKGAENDQTAFDKDYTAVSNAGRSAANLQEHIPLAKNLTLNPNFYSGPFHEGVESYNQFKAIFGTNPSAATPMEAFNKVTNQILADQIKAMGQSGVGRVLQAEVRIMQQGIASLGITPQSNRAQLEMLNRVYQRQQELAGVADQVKQNVASLPPMQRQAALNQALMQYQQSHPMFDQNERQHPEVLGAPDAPPQYPQWSPQQQANWAHSIGLHPGDAIRGGPNGYVQAR